MAAEVSHLSKLMRLRSTTDPAEVLREWEIEGIEKLHVDESKKCLCGRATREICHIVNSQTGQKAQIGNECVIKMEREDPSGSFLTSIPKIFEACSVIFNNCNHSAGEELVEFATKKGIFSRPNEMFYLEIIEGGYSPLIQKYKKNLNQILIAMVSSVKMAYHMLKEKKTKITAPRLIEYAFEKKVLNEDEKRFFLETWTRTNIPYGKLNYLSREQIKRQKALKERIITQLHSDPLFLLNGQQSLSKFFARKSLAKEGGIPKEGSKKRKRDMG